MVNQKIEKTLQWTVRNTLHAAQALLQKMKMLHHVEEGDSSHVNQPF